MKRSASSDPSSSIKKLKMEEEQSQVPDLTEDLIYEILRRADERTLGAAACVSTRWKRLAADERLWEAVCVKHWAAICSSAAQLRHVVITLGGFRKIYTSLLHPLVGVRNGGGVRRRWSRDELQMSLAMMSVGMFGKMSGIPGKKK
ncbi:hypothetical protein LUZ60_017126 [Juncus effusus]|nr:hypothetical protein LUZ60_017126 [Juncus effusus]